MLAVNSEVLVPVGDRGNIFLTHQREADLAAMKQKWPVKYGPVHGIGIRAMLRVLTAPKSYTQGAGPAS
jgi:hypothetical protein